MVTPFGVPARWLASYLQGAAPDIEGKQRARCLIKGGMLTVPVAGGASVLKRRGADPLLSDHGKWRREHLGAWQAAYGRTPYFEHLMPEIADVYAASVGMRLEEFNGRLLGIALRWLDEGSGADIERLQGVREEICAKIQPELSVFDALFRLGKAAVFAFPAAH